MKDTTSESGDFHIFCAEAGGFFIYDSAHYNPVYVFLDISPTEYNRSLYNGTCNWNTMRNLSRHAQDCAVNFPGVADMIC